MMTLEPVIVERLREVLTDIENAGKLLSRQKLDGCYARFRDRFGPEVLAGLDGEQLLETMHAHGNHDSLVYWLEFKDDEELPARFGSIAGGSALKFGLYRSTESGEWMAGHPRAKETLSTDQAIAKARQHRDELVKGCKILDQLPDGATDKDYAKLQDDLSSAASSVSDSAWGHKYFHMLFPDKLDDFHSPVYQRFHLVKMLVTPPDQDGRYICADRYVAAASELGIPMNHLTSALNEMDGRPCQYWRIGTRLGGEDSIWPLMQETECVAVGWGKLESLADIQYDAASKERIRGMIQESYGGDARIVGRKTQELFNFVTRVTEGDVVLACDGEQVLGVGDVTGPYFFEKSDAPHRHPVEWRSIETWKIPVREGLRTTVCELKKHPANRIEAERRLLGAQSDAPRAKSIRTRLPGLHARIYDILTRKSQVILYGPPGTGKTYWAGLSAQEMAARFNFHKAWSELSDDQIGELVGTGDSCRGYVRICCFHPAYGYEDFIEGYRPISTEGQLHFEMRDGIFKRLCDDASHQPDKRFYLLIDEINRGDIPRIFGELLTVLEKTKRGKKITLPVSGRTFVVPENVYVIGTMNTADRSIALLDTALRRRFGFIELMPDLELLKDVVVAGIPVALWLKRLNQRICEHVGRDARNLQVGHTYFLEGSQPITTFPQFATVVREDIIPLLEEYCYEDYSVLEKILGPALVASDSLSIRDDLFAGAEETNLIAALLAPCPDISTSTQAVDAEPDVPAEDGAGEDEETDEATN